MKALLKVGVMLMAASIVGALAVAEVQPRVVEAAAIALAAVVIVAVWSTRSQDGAPSSGGKARAGAKS